MKFFGVFQNLEMKSLKYIFFQKKKKNLKNNLERIFHLQILENPKNFMISFFHPLNLSGVVLGENLSRSSFSPPQRFVGKKSFFKFHFLQK